jgi:hypothetical protein
MKSAQTFVFCFVLLWCSNLFAQSAELYISPVKEFGYVLRVPDYNIRGTLKIKNISDHPVKLLYVNPNNGYTTFIACFNSGDILESGKSIFVKYETLYLQRQDDEKRKAFLAGDTNLSFLCCPPSGTLFYSGVGKMAPQLSQIIKLVFLPGIASINQDVDDSLNKKLSQHIKKVYDKTSFNSCMKCNQESVYSEKEQTMRSVYFIEVTNKTDSLFFSQGAEISSDGWTITPLFDCPQFVFPGSSMAFILQARHLTTQNVKPPDHIFLLLRTSSGTIDKFSIKLI